MTEPIADEEMLRALALYVADLRSYLSDPQAPALERLDRAFADLRRRSRGSTHQRMCVDRAGMAVSDLVATLTKADGAPDHARTFLLAHDAALRRVIEALAPLAA